MPMRTFDRDRGRNDASDEDVGAQLFDPDEMRGLYTDGPPSYLDKPRRRRMKKSWRRPE